METRTEARKKLREEAVKSDLIEIE